MAYTRHLDTMTVAIETPFWRKTHRRPAQITMRQYKLLVKVFDGYTGTQRELARETGYTLGGVNMALDSLHSLGALVVDTTKGRLGRTILRLRRGVRMLSLGNVQGHFPWGKSSSRTSSQESLNISSDESFGSGLQAFLQLRETLFGGAR